MIIAEKNGQEIPCHCPNPGRLSELLFPGTELLLERRKEGGAAKTEWTVVACLREDKVIPLFSSRANETTEKLILPKILPDLTEVRREFSMGHSRFDFFALDTEGRRHLLEVKACSLVEHGLAMFPDAPSERALKHLDELAHFRDQGFICHVIFVIVHGEPASLMPNLHTDLAFAQALCRHHREGLRVHGALIHSDRQGRAHLVSHQVPLDLSEQTEELSGSDGGNYLITLELESCVIEAGALGKLSLEGGWYVYAGSARKGLSARVARHLRRAGKAKHWHIDYLVPQGKNLKGLPILSLRNLECDLARDLEKIGGRGIRGFGSSDCRCESHLFYFKVPFKENQQFQDLLFRYRHRECFIPEGGLPG